MSSLFATTRWTLLEAAANPSAPQSRVALEELCRMYWQPLYAYVRRRGHGREDAEDLTQSFFADFLERRSLEGLEARKGKFRAFLLAALQHFLANAYDKQRRLKRGGDMAMVSLDWDIVESQLQMDSNPERAFDREWAIALLENVLERLRQEHVSKEIFFEHMKPFLTADKEAASYAQAANALCMKEGAVRVAAHRLRKHYRALLRDEIARTLSDPAGVDEEMRALFGAVVGGSSIRGGE